MRVRVLKLGRWSEEVRRGVFAGFALAKRDGMDNRYGARCRPNLTRMLKAIARSDDLAQTGLGRDRRGNHFCGCQPQRQRVGQHVSWPWSGQSLDNLPDPLSLTSAGSTFSAR
jgi:hypothetical protein